MSVHQTPPEGISNAGLDFSYSAWSAGSIVRLVNVPWDSEYRDIVGFNAKSDFVSYIQGLASADVVLRNVTYAKPFHPIRLPLSHNQVSQYNYVLVYNPTMPNVDGDFPFHYGYFITSVEYIAPMNTQITVQLDVWNTFGHDVEFGRAFVERGHIGMAHGNVNDNNGRDYLCVPEGLDMGNEYLVSTIDRRPLTDVDPDSSPTGIVVISTVDLAANPGTVDNPEMVTSQGHNANGIPQGASAYYLKDVQQFRNMLYYLSSRPWVAQGIISITMVPAVNESELSGDEFSVGNATLTRISSYRKYSGLTLVTNWRGRVYQDLYGTLFNRYGRLTKFLTYPYSFFELTLFNGKPLVLKPEMLDTESDDLEIGYAQMLTPPNQRTMIWARNYAAKSATRTGEISSNVHNDVGEWLDHATGLTDYPQISIVNNSYLNYLASNANSLAFQHQSADWSQQKALAGAQTAYDVTSGAISTASELNQIGMQARQQATDIGNNAAIGKAAVGVVGNVAGGAMRGGLAGAGMGALGSLGTVANTAIDIHTSNQQTANTNAAALRSTNASNAQAAFARDANNDLAKFAARGDYENQIAGINAKVQDAQMIPPTTSGQVGGDAFVRMLNNAFYVYTRFRMIPPYAMMAIGEFWLRYGYAVSRFTNMQNKLHCMTLFTYWKVKEIYLRSSRCPETYRMAIRGIFEKGVTVWRNPGDIGRIDPADNRALEGIVL